MHALLRIYLHTLVNIYDNSGFNSLRGTIKLPVKNSLRRTFKDYFFTKQQVISPVIISLCFVFNRKEEQATLMTE